MLVLTRRLNQSIQIGPRIRLTVLGLDSGIARVAITGPVGESEEAFDLLEGESVMAAPGIRVAMVLHLGNQARLGIEAPNGVTILRVELLPPGWAMGDPLRSHRPKSKGTAA